MAMEVESGLWSIRMVHEKTTSLVRKTLCNVVEDKMGGEMCMQKKMQMRRGQTKNRKIGAFGGKQMAGDEPDRD